jgi:hypothetical protein
MRKTVTSKLMKAGCATCDAALLHAAHVQPVDRIRVHPRHRDRVSY